MYTAEIMVRGCFEYDRDNPESAWTAALFTKLGWRIENEGFNHDKVWFVRCDGKEYVRLNGSQYTRLSFAYDPMRWAYNATGDEPNT